MPVIVSEPKMTSLIYSLKHNEINRAYYMFYFLHNNRQGGKYNYPGRWNPFFSLAAVYMLNKQKKKKTVQIYNNAQESQSLQEKKN